MFIIFNKPKYYYTYLSFLCMSYLFIIYRNIDSEECKVLGFKLFWIGNFDLFLILELFRAGVGSHNGTFFRWWFCFLRVLTTIMCHSKLVSWFSPTVVNRFCYKHNKTKLDFLQLIWNLSLNNSSSKLTRRSNKIRNFPP